RSSRCRRVFSSGSIVSQLTQHGLIDEYQFVVSPTLFGSGRPLLSGISKSLGSIAADSRFTIVVTPHWWNVVGKSGRRLTKEASGEATNHRPSGDHRHRRSCRSL